MNFRANRKQNPYSQISRELLQDNKLSYKARGIMCYLLSKPDKWNAHIKDIANSIDGEKAIKSAFKELREHGYAKLVTRYNIDTKKAEGKFYDIFEDKEDCKNSPSIIYISNVEEKIKEEDNKKQIKEENKKQTAPFSDSLLFSQSGNGVVNIYNRYNKNIKNINKEEEETASTKYPVLGSRIIYGYTEHNYTELIAKEKRITFNKSVTERYLITESKMVSFLEEYYGDTNLTKSYLLKFRNSFSLYDLETVLKDFFNYYDLQEFDSEHHLYRAIIKTYERLKENKNINNIESKPYEVQQGIVPSQKDKEDIKNLYKS